MHDFQEHETTAGGYYVRVPTDAEAMIPDLLARVRELERKVEIAVECVFCEGRICPCYPTLCTAVSVDCRMCWRNALHALAEAEEAQDG